MITTDQALLEKITRAAAALGVSPSYIEELVSRFRLEEVKREAEERLRLAILQFKKMEAVTIAAGQSAATEDFQERHSAYDNHPPRSLGRPRRAFPRPRWFAPLSHSRARPRLLPWRNA